MRQCKTEPLVDEVELLQANPQYAHVRDPDGRETTIFTRHTAITGDMKECERQNDAPRNLESVTGRVSLETNDPSFVPTQVHEQNAENNIDLQPLR